MIMKKSELKILGDVFDMEVRAALEKLPSHLFQTKSKIAKALAEEGLLNFTSTVWRGVTISGYELTHAGRLAYCASV